MIEVTIRKGREAEALALASEGGGGRGVREGNVDRVRGTEGNGTVNRSVGHVISQCRLEGGHVLNAVRIPRLHHELTGIQGEDDDDGENGYDRDHDEELDQGEGLARFETFFHEIASWRLPLRIVECLDFGGREGAVVDADVVEKARGTISSVRL